MTILLAEDKPFLLSVIVTGVWATSVNSGVGKDNRQPPQRVGRVRVRPL